MGSHFGVLGVYYTGPWGFPCILSMCVLHDIWVFLQVTELQKDQVNVASTMIQNILANPGKETAELIKVAQEDYESEYSFSFLGT